MFAVILVATIFALMVILLAIITLGFMFALMLGGGA
jgi:hypothetical protein